MNIRSLVEGVARLKALQAPLHTAAAALLSIVMRLTQIVSRLRGENLGRHRCSDIIALVMLSSALGG